MKFLSERELEALPRWACVALAGRCARRVLPFYKGVYSEVEAAVQLAEFDSRTGGEGGVKGMKRARFLSGVLETCQSPHH